MFADQVGVRSDHLSGRTWGLRGRTPTTTRTGNRFGIDAMSAIGPRGKLYFTVFEGSFTARVFIAFLERLVGHFTAKVHLDLWTSTRSTSPRLYAPGSQTTPPRSSWASYRRIHPI